MLWPLWCTVDADKNFLRLFQLLRTKLKSSDMVEKRLFYSACVSLYTHWGRLPVKWSAFEALMFNTYTTKSNVWVMLWRIFLSYLLSLGFVSWSLVFVHVLFSCFDLLFLLVLEFMLSSRIYLLPMLFAWHCQMLVFYRWSCLWC